MFAICLLHSCDNPDKAEKESNDAMPLTTPLSNKADIIDPVCGMIKDSTWIDYTVYIGDTVWFCAESEKRAFEGNPKKYESKLSIRK